MYAIFLNYSFKKSVYWERKGNFKIMTTLCLSWGGFISGTLLWFDFEYYSLFLTWILFCRFLYLIRQINAQIKKDICYVHE